jgi:hypothetical protein
VSERIKHIKENNLVFLLCFHSIFAPLFSKVDFLKVEYIMASRSKSPVSHYPETAIVAVTTHGVIKTSDAADGTLSASEFKVPVGMTILKYSEASAGTCNFADDETVSRCVGMISKFSKDIEVAADRKQIVQAIASQFKRRTKMFVGLLQSLSKKNSKQKNLVHYHNRGNTTRMFASGSKMVDKIYAVEELPSDSGYDNKILLLNADGQPDLFASILEPTPSKDYVSMEEVIAHLHAHGVKNVVLFDLSCSEADVSHPSKRAERKFNRDLSGKLGGSKKKRSIRKKRTVERKQTRRRYH